MAKPIFYYKIIKSRRSKFGGTDETAEVYEVKNKQIVKIGETSWATRGYKGAEGEIMDVLLKHKKISQDEYDKSANKNSGGGYYRRDLNNFVIKEL